MQRHRSCPALDAAGAALVNGTAVHGENFDDTLEGAPLRLARYGVEPDNEYPAIYSGHVRAGMRDVSVQELRQPPFRGGARAARRRGARRQVRGNVAHGSWPAERGDALLQLCVVRAEQPTLERPAALCG